MVISFMIDLGSNSPIKDQDEWPVEGDEDAEVAVVEHSDGEHEKVDPDQRHVGNTVQQDHSVH